ncbi:hypothetical protein LCGC14_1098310 [marine sediment metagenome]|uniref:Uncharacterized protein n=1 Tax=marine sediment metagenome TaxID=412755 RepID=A0A0F9MY60_9ZZZZ
MANRIIDDKRLIERAWSAAPHEVGATVGWPLDDPVTKIEPYEENGEMAPVTWLRVWKGGHLVLRLNASLMVEIGYVPVPIPISDVGEI